ncbi:MAG: hypothetical protein LBK50_02340 [Candidatus Nomurabacteria bacterium]|jgi:hypothetical protein|nr:hypothetical protein [Candidatus Nomurabacteria bacterium]
MSRFKNLGTKTKKTLGMILMAVNVVFALAWLFRVDLLVPELALQLDNEFLAWLIVILSVVAAIGSIPFLLGYKVKSKILKLISGIFAVVPAWLWTGVTIWTLGGLGDLPYIGPAVQFTTYASFSANWLVLVLDLLWLLMSVIVIQQYGIEDIYGSKKKTKDG